MTYTRAFCLSFALTIGVMLATGQPAAAQTTACALSGEYILAASLFEASGPAQLGGTFVFTPPASCAPDEAGTVGVDVFWQPVTGSTETFRASVPDNYYEYISGSSLGFDTSPTLAGLPLPSACTANSLRVSMVATQAAANPVPPTFTVALISNELPTALSCSAATTEIVVVGDVFECSSAMPVPLSAGDKVSLGVTSDALSATGQFMFGVGVRCN